MELVDRPLVLFADDDAGVRRSARRALRREGFDLLEAADGDEAVEAFDRSRPELVLLDVRMPRKDGFDACLAIRAHARGADVPVVLVTGADDPAAVERAYDSGATDFVSKPIQWTVLGQRLHYMLRAGRAFRALRRSLRTLANAQRLAGLGHWRIDLVSGCAFLSPEIEAILGRFDDPDKVPFADLLARVHPEDRGRLERAMADTIAGGQQGSFDYRIERADGERILHSLAEVERDETGRAVAVSGTSQDITGQRRAEERIRFLMHYDGLTGLANKRAFRERLEQDLAAAGEGAEGSVLVLELSGIDRLNDAMGTAAGDGALQKVTAALVDVVRVQGGSAAASRVARIGGDEFALTLTPLRSGETPRRVGEALVEALRRPLDVDGRAVTLMPRIGVAAWPADGTDAEGLLRNAQAALHQAQRQSTPIAFFSHDLSECSARRLEIECALRVAMEQGELTLHYQPKVELDTGAFAGVEALLRWNSSTLGPVSPGEFVPVAEEAELVEPIGSWALHHACQQHRRWMEAGLGAVRVAVNVSPLQLRGPGLLDSVRSALAEADMDPSYLELEITESAVMENLSEAIEILDTLRDLGVRLALDDFGTGFSSLGCLRRLPVHSVKIDRTFVRDVPGDPEDAGMAAAIVSLAKSLGLQVVAEGVETREQYDFFRELGCELMQGFLVSRPVDPATLESRVSNWPSSIPPID